MKRIVFMVGGPEFHPVGVQAGAIAQWLGEGYACELVAGEGALGRLEGAELLVVMGLYWPGMEQEWAGGMKYEPLGRGNAERLGAYVRSGRPVVSHHGGIASYPEAGEFAEACGWAWVWGETTHSPFGSWTTKPAGAGHAVMEGVGTFTVEDEIYYGVKAMEPGAAEVHAAAEFEGVAHPMVSTMEAVGHGRGRRVYLANGHDMRAFSGAAGGSAGASGGAVRRLWVNSVRWALGE